MSFPWLVATAIFVSFGFTWLMRRYALARQVVDVPNERSSHDFATPRGGGFAIVLTFISMVAALSLLGGVRPPLLWAICGGGGLVALVGFVDDHRHVAASLRLLVHFLAAASAVALLYVPASESAGVAGTQWGLLIVAVLSVVWLINLYNFMDGIDGIASIEAITVSVGGALVFYIAEPSGHLWMSAMLLAASVAGFLCWNYPPARIFMGDSGSGFLGFVVAIFCFEAALLGAHAFWAWMILLGVFITDSGVTLAHRLLRGERLHEAHCSHAYQHAARIHRSHARVSMAVGAVNMLWLLPVAVLVALSVLQWQLGLAIGYGPLLWLAWKYKSGSRDFHGDRPRPGNFSKS